MPRVGAISADYAGSLLDIRHRVPDDIHEVERALSLAHACGYELPDDDDGALQIERRPALPGAAAALERLSPYVVVHPGASTPTQAWSPGRVRELVALLADVGLRVVITGSATELALAEEVCRDARPSRLVNLVGGTDLAGLAEVIALARAILVANTGPAHLAAAVGTPVVSIYAPTVAAERWRPWMVPHELLSAPVPCAGCRAHTCPVAGHPCVERVSADEALAAILRLAAIETPTDVPAPARAAFDALMTAA